MTIHDTLPAMGKAALEYAERGWHVFPAKIEGGAKKGCVAGKANGGERWGATTCPDRIRDYWMSFPYAMLGVATGPKSGVFVVEADTPDGHDVDGIANLAALIEKHGPLPATIEALSPSNSWHLWFKWPEGLDIRNSASVIGEGIDVRGEGGMVLTAPSIRKGFEKAYRWKNPPGFFELADCPDWLLDKITAGQRRMLSERAAPMPPIDTARGWGEAALREEIATLMAAIETKRNDALNRAAFKLGQLVPGGHLPESLIVDRLTATAFAIGLDDSEIRPTIESGLEAGKLEPREPKGKEGPAAPPDAPEPRSYDELMEAAQALEPGQIDDMEAIVIEAAGLNPMRRDAIFRAIKDATKVPLGTLRDQSSYGSDTDEPDHLDLARITLRGIGRENIICADAFVWQWSDAGVWAQQDDRAIKQATQNVIDTEGVDVTASLVNGVTDVLKSEIFKPGHEFNRGNPEAVNCLNGEIELQDGCWVLQPHCREHYRTTQIPVTHDRGADAPLFRAFLNQVFQDDADNADKIRSTLELMGYTLMSHARHERFVMLIGPGANGKSVLLAVLEGLLGHENVAGVQPSNFENRFQRAHLHQKLANIVTELKQGEVIADAELKAITSGEPATVEHKFQNPFVMRPFATCWFGTNHMPHTRDFSEALFRRATILQFNRTFAPHEQDPLLKEKLLTELPGILNMTLDAYASALTEGFMQPQSSEAAKKEWRLEADQVAQFVDDDCQRSLGERTPVGVVFIAYQSWAQDNGIGKTMSAKGMRDRLTRLGFGADRDRTTRYVTGLRVGGF